MEEFASAMPHLGDDSDDVGMHDDENESKTPLFPTEKSDEEDAKELSMHSPAGVPSSAHCRICHDPETPGVNELYSPCACSGTIEFVHQSCLVKWTTLRQTTKCELCQVEFEFERIFASDTPEDFNWLHILCLLLRKLVVVDLPTAARHALVCICWTMVPLCTTMLCKLFFFNNFIFRRKGGLQAFLLEQATAYRDSPALLYMDIVAGLCLSCGIILLSVAFASFREFLALDGQQHDLMPEEVVLQGAEPHAPPVAGAQEENHGEEQEAKVEVPAAAVGEDQEEEEVVVLEEGEEKANNGIWLDEGAKARAFSWGFSNDEPQLGEDEDSEDGEPWMEDGKHAEEDEQKLEGLQEEEEEEEDDEEEEDEELEDALADWENATLWELAGFEGPLHLFVLHICSVIAFNALFLMIHVLAPEVLGRVSLWFVDTDVEAVFVALRQPANATGTVDGITLMGAAAYNATMSAVASVSEISALAELPADAVLQNLFLIGLGYNVMLFGMIAVASSLHEDHALNLMLRDAAVSLKIAMLTTLELAVFPVVLGYAIDAFTLFLHPPPDSLELLYARFRARPFMTTMMRWLVGICFMVAVSFTAGLLRKTVRESILRKFLRFPDDPDFAPLHDMIHNKTISHMRRLVVTLILYLLLIFLGIHLPGKIYAKLLPSLAPLQFRIQGETEVFLDPVVAHFIVPFALGRIELKTYGLVCFQFWFTRVATLLGIREYLLHEDLQDQQPQQEQQQPVEPQEEGQNEEVGAAEPAGPVGAAPVPLASEIPHFALRVFALLLVYWVSVFLTIGVFILLPLFTGRALLVRSNVVVGRFDLIAYDIGLYLLLASVAGSVYMYRFFRDRLKVAPADAALPAAQDSERDHWVWMLVEFVSKLCDGVVTYCTLGSKMIATGAMVYGLLPFLVGLFVDLAVIMPLRVGITETPRLFLLRDWAVGLVLFKAWTRLVRFDVIRDERWKPVLERVMRHGVYNTEVRYTANMLVWPIARQMALLIVVPYVLGVIVFPVVVDLCVSSDSVVKFLDKLPNPPLLASLGSEYETLNDSGSAAPDLLNVMRARPFAVDEAAGAQPRLGTLAMYVLFWPLLEYPHAGEGEDGVEAQAEAQIEHLDEVLYVKHAVRAACCRYAFWVCLTTLLAWAAGKEVLRALRTRVGAILEERYVTGKQLVNFQRKQAQEEEEGKQQEALLEET